MPFDADQQGRIAALNYYYPNIYSTMQSMAMLQTELRDAVFSTDNDAPDNSHFSEGVKVGVTESSLPPKIKLMHNIAQFEVSLYQQLKALQMSKKAKNATKTGEQIIIEHGSFVPLLHILTEHLSDSGLLRKKVSKKSKMFNAMREEVNNLPL